jgi:ParB/RepB/Spo0J family partition protein
MGLNWLNSQNNEANMSQTTVNNALMISVDSLYLPSEYRAKSNKVEDEFLANSIRTTGIQQPLIVTKVAPNRYIVIDGGRRLFIAQHLKHAQVPCVVDSVPKDIDPELYRNRIRFILDEHRQDLMPTQRAELIRKLENMFRLSRKEVAVYLGVTPSTVSNWTIVDDLIPEIREALDAGVLRVHTTRAFQGMTEKGQQTIWRDHKDEASRLGSAPLHRFVRQNYPPETYTDYYKNPTLAAAKLAKGQPKHRKGKRRQTVMPEARKALSQDFDFKTAELDDKRASIRELDECVSAAIPVIESIWEIDELWTMLPRDVQDDFTEFMNRFASSVA